MADNDILMCDVSEDSLFRETLCTILAPYLSDGVPLPPSPVGHRPQSSSAGAPTADVVIILMRSTGVPLIHLLSPCSVTMPAITPPTSPDAVKAKQCFGLVQELVAEAHAPRDPTGDDDRFEAKEDDRAALTPREIDVLGGLQQGESNKEIARRLQIAEATVKVHIRSVLGKTNTQNRTQAAIWACQNADSLSPSA